MRTCTKKNPDIRIWREKEAENPDLPKWNGYASYDMIDDWHWKTDRQASCQFNLAHKLKS